MDRNVLNAKERTLLPHRKGQDVNECFYIGRGIIKFISNSGATVNVIPATFVKDKKIKTLLKKGKKLDISVYGGKKG